MQLRIKSDSRGKRTTDGESQPGIFAFLGSSNSQSQKKKKGGIDQKIERGDSQCIPKISMFGKQGKGIHALLFFCPRSWAKYSSERHPCPQNDQNSQGGPCRGGRDPLRVESTDAASLDSLDSLLSSMSSGCMTDAGGDGGGRKQRANLAAAVLHQDCAV